jgi:hypothetical protein
MFERKLTGPLAGKEIYVQAEVAAVDPTGSNAHGLESAEIVRRFVVERCIVKRGTVYKLWVDEAGDLRLEIS